MIVHLLEVLERTESSARIGNPFAGCVLKADVIAEFGVPHGKLGLNGS
jgi:hypothetical protein